MKFFTRTDVGDVPIAKVDLMTGVRGCANTPRCNKFYEQFTTRMVGRYATKGNVFRTQKIAAVVDLRGRKFEGYLEEARAVHKGAALRQKRKAERNGFFTKEFPWPDHIPDVHEINTSKDVRSGGEMRGAYQRSVDELGGAPQKFHDMADNACSLHALYNWGVFSAIPGYRQGRIVTDEKLVAYIRLKRNGNLLTYTTILGHGEYLNYGVMYKAHFDLMEKILQDDEGVFSGAEYLLYSTWDPNNLGAHQWKRRGLFEPRYLVLETP